MISEFADKIKSIFLADVWPADGHIAQMIGLHRTAPQISKQAAVPETVGTLKIVIISNVSENNNAVDARPSYLTGQLFMT